MSKKQEDNRDIFDKILDDIGPMGGLVVGGVAGRYAGGALKKALSKKARDNARYGRELLRESRDHAKTASPQDRAYLKNADRQNKEQFIDGPLRGARIAGAGAGAGAGAAYGDSRTRRK